MEQKGTKTRTMIFFRLLNFHCRSSLKQKQSRRERQTLNHVSGFSTFPKNETQKVQIKYEKCKKTDFLFSEFLLQINWKKRKGEKTLKKTSENWNCYDLALFCKLRGVQKEVLKVAIFRQVRSCTDNFIFQEYICQVFQKPEANFRNMNFRFLLILHDYVHADQSDQVRKPKKSIFYKHGSRKHPRTSGFKVQNFSDLFLVIYKTYCFFQTIARQRKFSMYWKSFLRSERLGQALFLPSLRATSILSGFLVAAISLS